MPTAATIGETEQYIKGCAGDGYGVIMLVSRSCAKASVMFDAPTFHICAEDIKLPYYRLVRGMTDLYERLRS